MNKRFRTYNELVAEQARLKALAYTQKLQVKEDLAEIKEELEPVFHLTATLKKFVTYKSVDILTSLGINLFANGLVKKIILSKAGWLTRILVPMLVKNYTTHFVNASGSFMDKIKGLFSKNGKQEEHSKQEDHSGMDAV